VSGTKFVSDSFCPPSPRDEWARTVGFAL